MDEDVKIKQILVATTYLLVFLWEAKVGEFPSCRPLPRRSLRLRQCCQSDSLGKGWESGLANLARQNCMVSEMEGLWIPMLSN